MSQVQNDPWVWCRIQAKDVTEEHVTCAAFVRREPNGDVIVKYRASELRHASS